MKVLVITAEKLEYEAEKKVIGLATNKNQYDKVISNFFKNDNVTKVGNTEFYITPKNTYTEEVYTVDISETTTTDWGEYPYNVLIGMEWHDLDIKLYTEKDMDDAYDKGIVDGTIN